jgi:hypothetical protein
VQEVGDRPDERRDERRIQGDAVKDYERRYHASWFIADGLSPLAKLAEWMCSHPGQRASAPRDLLVTAAADVGARLPVVAAREPTRRHRKHFAWLLGWQLRLAGVIETPAERRA